MSLPPEFAAWAGTILTLGVGQVSIDLREPVGEPARRVLGSLRLAGPFAIVTPCNPEGRVLAPAENARRLSAAGAVLAARGWTGVPATGRALDGSHWEPGWALTISKPDAIALATDWEQHGFYWWDGGGFSIVLVNGGEFPLPLQVGTPLSESGGVP